jgi:hypothetical protein
MYEKNISEEALYGIKTTYLGTNTNPYLKEIKKRKRRLRCRHLRSLQQPQL